MKIVFTKKINSGTKITETPQCAVVARPNFELTNFPLDNFSWKRTQQRKKNDEDQVELTLDDEIERGRIII